MVSLPSTEGYISGLEKNLFSVYKILFYTQLLHKLESMETREGCEIPTCVVRASFRATLQNTGSACWIDAGVDIPETLKI